MCCRSIWVCSCEGRCHGSVCAERRQCRGRPALMRDASSENRPGHRCTVLGYEQKDLLIREFFRLKYAGTLIQSWLSFRAASSHAISQLNFSLNFQTGRGKKWLWKSCRTLGFFPQAELYPFSVLWIYIAIRATLTKSSRFDSFYVDVSVWGLYS